MTMRQLKTIAYPQPLKRASVDGLSKLPAARQKRLDELMARNNNGSLTSDEQQELRALVGEAESVALANARALADGHKRK